MKVSKHHYAVELSRIGNKVFFINPPDVNSKIFQTDPSGVNENLKIVSYNPIYRGNKYLPKFLFNLLVRFQIYLLKRYLKTDIDIVFSFMHNYFINLKWFGVKHTFFCPYDQLNNSEAYKTADSANYVITVSDYIAEEINKSSTPILLLKHGLSSDFVNYAVERTKTASYTDYSTKKSVLKIGFVGNLFFQFLERDILRKIITENNRVEFVFWGPVKPVDSNISAWEDVASFEFIKFLETTSNVKLRGVCPPDIVAKEIQEIDGFLFCHEVHPENKMHNSHKILEYLSTGKMVITTPLLAYKDTPDKLVLMYKEISNANFPDYFKKQIIDIEINNDIEIQKMRVLWALKNSYANQIRIINDWVEKQPNCLTQ